MQSIISLSRTLLAAALVFCGSITATAGTQYSLSHIDDPAWTIHSAFDNAPKKVIDTPSKVFFLVNQHRIKTNDWLGNFLKEPHCALFVYDKEHPELGIRDLRKVARLTRPCMRLAAWNPAGEYLTVAHDDGSIEIVDNQYRVTTLNSGRPSLYPGMSCPTALLSAPGSPDTWISTNAGYVHIKAENGTYRVAEAPVLGEKVQCIAPVGNRLVAVINGNIYDAPADRALKFDDFTQISFEGNLPTMILPLSGNCFAYTVSGALRYATLTADGWISGYLFSAAIQVYGNADKLDALDHTVLPTARGWMLHNQTAAWEISAPPAPGAKPEFRSKAIPDDALANTGSWDFENFWTYQSRTKFGCRKTTNEKGSATASDWTWTVDPIAPDAPLSAMKANFAYSPKYGMIMTSSGCDPRTSWHDNVIGSALLTTYRGGHWTNRSQSHTRPSLFSERPGAAVYNPNNFPVCDPRGICPDPLFPDWVHIGSFWGNTATVPLHDQTVYPMIYTDNLNGLSNLPSLLPYEYSPWGHFIGSPCAGADADGNIWYYYNRRQAQTPAWNLLLYYITPDMRREALETADITKMEPWKSIEVQYGGNPGLHSDVKVLRHPKNKNTILFFLYNDAREVVLFNHNGTLDDTSDDTYKRIRKILLPSGYQQIWGDTYFFVEDPNTGDIIASSSGGTMVFDPTAQPVDGRTFPGRELTFAEGAATDGQSLLSDGITTDLCFDEYGRLWVATRNNGIYGFDTGANKILAHYTTANSPLPTDYVWSLGWNPETHSLLASTLEGVAEVRPSLADGTDFAAAPGTGPVLSPEFVPSDYAGTVALRNLPDNVILQVTDHNGRHIASLPAATGGTTHWDLVDTDSHRVPTGRYTITDLNNSIRPLTLTVRQ